MTLPPCGRTHCVCPSSAAGPLSCVHLWPFSITCRVLCQEQHFAAAVYIAPLLTFRCHHQSLPGGEGHVPRYFWSHLPFFPDQRQRMKNKTSCCAPPLPTAGLSPWAGILFPGWLPALENSQKSLWPPADEAEAGPRACQAGGFSSLCCRVSGVCASSHQKLGLA